MRRAVRALGAAAISSGRVSQQRRRLATRPQKMTLTPQMYVDGEKIALEYSQKYGYKEFQRLAKYLEILAQTAIAKERVVPAFQQWIDVYSELPPEVEEWMLELLERTATDYVAIHGAEFSAGCTNVREVEVSISPKDPGDSHTIQIQLQHDESITGSIGASVSAIDMAWKWRKSKELPWQAILETAPTDLKQRWNLAEFMTLHKELNTELSPRQLLIYFDALFEVQLDRADMFDLDVTFQQLGI